MKTDVKNSGLYDLVQYLKDTGSPKDDAAIRAGLRARSGRLAEARKRAAEGDRTVFGIPFAETLREWLGRIKRPNLEVIEGDDEPTVVGYSGESAARDVSGAYGIDTDDE